MKERYIETTSLRFIHVWLFICPLLRKGVSPKFTELCIHGDAMLVPVQMGTNKNIYH